jgi:indoleamine 2,3-dioxygenase
MPDTPLTEILKDFRAYRPGNHRDFLEWVHVTSQAVGLKEYAMENESSTGKLTVSLLLT